MDNSNKVVIISDNKRASETLLSKIHLLRGTDVIQVYTSSDALKMLQKSAPELIILYADVYTERCFDILSDIKLLPTYKNIPVLLVCEHIEQEFILSAFDEGISDYITLEASESEFLMRIIWSLQKSTLVKKCEQNMEQLLNLEVVYKDTFFYKEAFVDKIFSATIKKVHEHRKFATLMIVTPDVDSKYKLSGALLATILKKTLRSTDMVGVKEDNKFYVLLNNTRTEGVNGVYNRLKEELTLDYTISIGAAAVDEESFENVEKYAKIALQDALIQKNKVIVYRAESTKSSPSWLDNSDMTAPHKNFKLFKQSFTKKLSNVITPVFYQMQKMYEEKLFKTDIIQTLSEGESMFKLKSENVESTLKITYPGFSKINIDFSHISILGEENNRISLSLAELDNSKLTLILEKFIKEYRSMTNG